MNPTLAIGYQNTDSVTSYKKLIVHKPNAYAIEETIAVIAAVTIRTQGIHFLGLLS